jgi:hypothetical protein
VQARDKSEDAVHKSVNSEQCREKQDRYAWHYKRGQAKQDGDDAAQQ